jgi:hypothetical protein
VMERSLASAGDGDIATAEKMAHADVRNASRVCSLLCSFVVC